MTAAATMGQSCAMLDLLVQRIASLLVGGLLGLIIAIGLLVLVEDIDPWWVLLAAPLLCAVIAAIAGDRALAVLKKMADLPE